MAIFGCLIGVGIGIGTESVVNVYKNLSKESVYLLKSGSLGALVFGLGSTFAPYAIRIWQWLRTNGWQITEAKFSSFGTEFKITSTGSQRRAAWVLCVDLATRIITQDLADEDGDDGEAMDSLYKFFQFARKTLSEMQPTPAAEGDTVDSFVIHILNHVLRPFLSRWHPQWDEWHKANPGKMSMEWRCHEAFRADLRVIQKKSRQVAARLAEIAGYTDAEKRLFG